LGDIAADLERLEAGVDSGPAGDRCAMASSRFQTVLDVDLAASDPIWKKMRQQGIA
jgi:hypothetical protein